MPGHYTHYRFASEQLAHMDGEAGKAVDRFRRLYNMGAQGPDPLFYYNPFLKNQKYALGDQIHRSPGREFFERAGRIYRAKPTEGAYAYLLGCLTHFCLDSVCHPFVDAQDASGAGEHIALETEFNRFLMELDGKPMPHTQNPGEFLSLSAGESETAAAFYRDVTAGAFARSAGSMKLFLSLFSAPEGPLRELVAAVTGKLGYGGFIMTKGPDPRHCVFNGPMLELYRQAAQRFPGMLAQLRDHFKTEAPLGEEFDAIYG